MTDRPESLDALIERILQRAEGSDQGYHRVGLLVSAADAVSKSLDLSARLLSIVEVARELVGARYGALGVLAPDSGLEKFIHSGFTEEQVRALGDPPSGRGILGAVITEQRSIRLEHLSEDPRSVGFPPNHPAMDSFLGVPIYVDGTIFGNLYLTERSDGPFDDLDEAIIAALATMAGTAIANSRLYEQSEGARRWLAASERLTQRLLAGEVEPDDLDTIISTVRQLSDAQHVVIIENLQDDVQIAAAALRQGLDVEATLGPMLVVPLQGSADRVGAGLAIARGPHGHPFTEADRAMIAQFANSVAIARELARARIDEQWMTLTDERDRIARDLHDHVIQSLFAVGLSLQSVVGDPSAPRGARIASQVDAIDSTIRQIRQAIYRLSSPSGVSAFSLRARINTVVRDTLDGEPLDSHLAFSGPVDTLVDLGLADDVTAVVREALSNVVRHSRARLVEASVAVRGAIVVVTVRDDGVGMQQTQRRSGLANLAARARERGGEFVIEPVEPHGTEVRWSVPWGSQ